jgi:predicted phage terminase large subunit-like protein
MAIFEPTDREPVDPIRRDPGVALCEARMPLPELKLTRDQMGESWFQAMFQGHPSLDDGNLIRRPFRYYTIKDGVYETIDETGAREYYDEASSYRFATLDLAATDKKTADFTVMMVFDVTASSPRKLFIRAIERERITTENHEQLVKDWYHRWNLQALHIENKTFGTNLLGRLIGQPGMIVTALKADTNKIVRAMPVQYEIRNGMLFFPKEAEWLRTFEAEVTKFPNSTHDDMVDCLGYGVQVFKSLPGWIQKKVEPATPDEVVWEHMRELGKKNLRKRGNTYPGIGKW